MLRKPINIKIIEFIWEIIFTVTFLLHHISFVTWPIVYQNKRHPIFIYSSLYIYYLVPPIHPLQRQHNFWAKDSNSATHFSGEKYVHYLKGCRWGDWDNFLTINVGYNNPKLEIKAYTGILVVIFSNQLV